MATASATPVMPWHYERNGRPVGPFDDAEMVRLAEGGRIDAITLVSADGGRSWTSAREAAESFGLDPARLHSGEAGPALRCARCAAEIPADELVDDGGPLLCLTCSRKPRAATGTRGAFWRRLFSRPDRTGGRPCGAGSSP